MLRASVTYPLKKTKPSLPHILTLLRLSPGQYWTSHQPCRGPRVRVAPTTVIPKAIARGW
jgi:hypothetical protein